MICLWPKKISLIQFKTLTKHEKIYNKIFVKHESVKKMEFCLDILEISSKINHIKWRCSKCKRMDWQHLNLSDRLVQFYYWIRGILKTEQPPDE